MNKNLTYPPDTIITNKLQKILDIRFLTESTFVLKIERGNLEFKAGQYITIGKENSIHRREYSIYSGENDDYLEIIIREVINGDVSKQLKHCRPGDLLAVEGPFGYMTIHNNELDSRKFLFIATGTGIAPFHSFVRSYPGIDYTILHGVKYAYESYEKFSFAKDKYILCTSAEEKGDFYGRVTGYLKGIKITPSALIYICGNSDMIYDSYDILRDKGILTENIRTEVYF